MKTILNNPIIHPVTGTDQQLYKTGFKMMAQNQKTDLSQQNNGFTVIFAAPILPGRSEAWRRWLQEMIESHHPEYEESRRCLGVSGEWVWIAETGNGHVAVIAMAAAQPEQVLAQLANSERPFDRWYREQLLALQGLDLTKPLSRASPELVLEWRVSKNQS
jgi:hypothetical protein